MGCVVGKDHKEAERLCKLLTSVYHCSDEIAAHSFSKVGASLVPHIFKLLQKGKEVGTGFKYAERLLRRLSSVEISLQSVKNREDILAFFMKTIRNNVKSGNTSIVNHALSLLAGLALHQESKVIVMNFPGLFDTVVLVANNEDVESRHQSARLLSRLAWNIKTRASIGTQECVDALVTMSFSSHPKLQSEALATLQLLSIESRSKAKLVSSKQGKLVQSLMGIIGANTGDDQLRLQAFNVLLNLISRETFKSIASHPGLIASLASLSTSSKEPEMIAALAAHCIKRLATHVQVTDNYHEDFLRAIVDMSQCDRKTVMQWASKALLDQSALSSNSFCIVRDQNVLQSLAHLISYSSRNVKEPALEAVVNLSENRSNVTKLASSSCLVAALVSSIDDLTCSEETILRRHAVRAILSLATHRSSTKRIAKHLGLVEALSRYGISTQDNDVELKRAALHGVLILAPLL